MKKLFLFLACFIINIENVRAEEPLSAEEQSVLIYEKCAAQASKTTAAQPILGNIEDIKRERDIKNCIKKEILKTTSQSLSKNNAADLKKALSDVEKALFNIYKILLFCQNNEDDGSNEKHLNLCFRIPTEPLKLNKSSVGKRLFKTVQCLAQFIRITIVNYIHLFFSGNPFIAREAAFF